MVHDFAKYVFEAYSHDRDIPKVGRHCKCLAGFEDYSRGSTTGGFYRLCFCRLPCYSRGSTMGSLDRQSFRQLPFYGRDLGLIVAITASPNASIPTMEAPDA